MALLRLSLSGSAHRFHSDATSGVVEQTGVLGVDIGARTVGETNYTVVQLLLEDEGPTADLSMLRCPLVAEISQPSAGPEGSAKVIGTALFDHDRFRQKLQAEQAAGESVTRGVLLTTAGELPPVWTRFAFIPVPLRVTAGMELRIYRSTIDELNDKVEQAFAAGTINETERRNMLISVQQHYDDQDSEPADVSAETKGTDAETARD